MARKAVPAHGWWGEQWLAYMDREHLFSPLTSGQIKGAERGEAVLRFAKGQVIAEVGVGSYGDSQTATLKLKPLTDRQWRRVVEALAERPDVAQRLLGGTLGAELEEAFAAADAALFPEGGGSLRCTCREAWGCRHTRVLMVRGAPMLDTNPFLWLQVRGFGREDLLAAVRARLADKAGSALIRLGVGPSLLSPERFLSTDTDPALIPVRPGHTSAPDALLRLLGPVPLAAELNQISTETADEVLGRYLSHISTGAADLADGNRSPLYLDEALPGKKVALKSRLVPEIEQVIEETEGFVSLSDLQEACPTAAALPRDLAIRALKDAVPGLSDDFLGLAGRYVARRSALLTGATFRHVITVREWLSGRLSANADWQWIMSIAGCQPPYQIKVGNAVCRVHGPDHQTPDSLFALLHPEVGDELHLRVVDASVPLLAGRLQRRQFRSLTDLLDTDRYAVQALRDRLPEAGGSISEQGAVELLLGEGLYRDGLCPDPIWLLPARAVGTGLAWGHARRLTSAWWQSASLPLGRSLYGVWRDRQNTLSQFTAALVASGETRRAAEAAQSLVEAWCRHFPGDQRDGKLPPPLATLVDFLWNVVPPEARRLRIPPERVTQVLAGWFRFLAERHTGLAGVYQEHIAVCTLEAAYVHRQETLPAGRGGAGKHDEWLMEAYRWMGADLCFQPGV